MAAETTGEVLKRLAGLHPRSIDLSLDRIARLLAALGNPHEKLPPVVHVAGAGEKKELVRTLASGTSRRILFMRTKHHAKKLAQQLTAQGIPAVDLHGNLSQPARDRNLAAFSSGAAKVLVATDVAARGVHVDNVRIITESAIIPTPGATALLGLAGLLMYRRRRA